MSAVSVDWRTSPSKDAPLCDEGVLAWGQMHSADFSDKTLELRIEGDMPRVSRGRYVIVDAERFRMIVMQARLWREKQAEAQS